MINKDWGGGTILHLRRDTTVIRGDIELMGVPPLGKTLYKLIPISITLLTYQAVSTAEEYFNYWDHFRE